MMTMAHEKQSVIAIGHPYPATLEYLQLALPMLEEAGIRVVPVSVMIKYRLAKEQIAARIVSLSGGD